MTVRDVRYMHCSDTRRRRDATTGAARDGDARAIVISRRSSSITTRIKRDASRRRASTRARDDEGGATSARDRALERRRSRWRTARRRLHAGSLALFLHLLRGGGATGRDFLLLGRVLRAKLLGGERLLARALVGVPVGLAGDGVLESGAARGRRDDDRARFVSPPRARARSLARSIFSASSRVRDDARPPSRAAATTPSSPSASSSPPAPTTTTTRRRRRENPPKKIDPARARARRAAIFPRP